MDWKSLFGKKGKIISKDDNSITFEVDTHLPKPEQSLWMMNGDEIEKQIIETSNIINKEKACIKSSFRTENLGWVGSDVLYKCMVDAYADHRPLILSPDMIWLVLCQAFSHHINSNPEKYRSLIVNHNGKKDILVESNYDLLSEDANWDELLDTFFEKLEADTKDSFADSIISDFSTTGKVERIASQITIMDIAKSFYNYQAFYCICGIPQITLEGTPEDWERIMSKLALFDRFDLQEWTSELRTILWEFVNASKGEVNSLFWKSIVCRYNHRSLRGVTCCDPNLRPSKLNGWFLKFFPYDSYGDKYKSAYYESTDMLSENVRVEMNFKKINPSSGESTSYPMELIAGFVGVEEKENKALRPRIGWMVKEADTKKDKDEYLKEQNERNGVNLTIDKVPEELKTLKHIMYLRLNFTDKIELPDWMDDLEIDYFNVTGKITLEEKESFTKRFPNIEIN